MIHTKIWTKLFIVIAVMAITISVQSQPNWSFDPALYEYTMTLTGVAVIQCKESKDERDMIGAFIGGELRGVQRFDGVVNDRNYAYMVIYDSIISGNQVHFKLYDASEDKIIDLPQHFIFTENGNIGNDANPFVFEPVPDSLIIEISQLSVYKYSKVGDTLLQFRTSNVLKDSLESEYQFVNDSLGVDNHYFKIHGQQLVLDEPIDQVSQTNLKLHIVSKTSTSCSKDINFVLNINEAVSTKDSDSKLALHTFVYPNPAFDNIYLSSLSDTRNVQLFDPIKNRFSAVSIESGNRIAINHLKNQIYYLVMHSESGCEWIRFAVVRTD